MYGIIIIQMVSGRHQSGLNPEQNGITWTRPEQCRPLNGLKSVQNIIILINPE